MFQSHGVHLTGLTTSQSYLAFMANGVSLHEADKHGTYKIVSRDDSSQEAYVIMPDDSGNLQLNLHRNQVRMWFAYIWQLLASCHFYSQWLSISALSTRKSIPHSLGYVQDLLLTQHL